MRALKSKRRASGGFTLVEVSIVVVCVAIVAALALVGFVRYRRTARMAEATNLIGMIRVEQEAHKGESGVYTTVSNSLTSYYPAANPGKFVTQWGADCSNCVSPKAWNSLNVHAPQPVAYGYATVAGVGEDISGMGNNGTRPGPSVGPVHPAGGSDDDDDTGPSPGGGGSNACTSISPTDPYYLVQAQGDTDGDGVACTVLALSCSNSLIMTNVGE